VCALVTGDPVVVSGASAVAQRFLQLQLGAAPAEPAALVVHASGLLELLAGLFESVWREGLPLRVGAAGVAEEQPDGPDATDLEVLSLLLAGMTDATVPCSAGCGG
jgi:hypothetical protein